MNINKLFIHLVIILFFACSDNKNETIDSTEMEREVAQADIDFSKRSVEIGWREAFIEYADTNVIKLNDKAYPSIGKQKLISDLMAKNIPVTDTLTWRPIRVNVAESGDLASSFGEAQYKTKSASNTDTIFYGNYITVWKRQKDGSWKFILDGGNSIPGPIDEKGLK